MSAKQPPATGRVTLDYRYIGAPHDLITDQRICPPAFRLWCVLAYMDWTHEKPSLPILQGYMQQSDSEPPTRRSLYRWLGELEARGWLEWIRAPGKAGINDRLALKTRREPVTPGSQDRQPVTPESQPVIVGSQVVTLRSQVDYFQALSEPLENTTQILSDLIDPPPPQRAPETSHGGGGDSYENALRSLLGSYGILAAQKIATQYAAMAAPPSIETISDAVKHVFDPNESHSRDRIARRLMDCPPPWPDLAIRAPTAPIVATRPNPPETPISQRAFAQLLKEHQRGSS